MRDPVGLAVAEELARRAQFLDGDALLERVVQFLDARGHLLDRAAIDDRDVGAEPARGARRVHRRVAAADDEHLLAAGLGQRGFVFRVEPAHQVDAGEELVGRHDAEQVLARHVHEGRQARAGADEDLPEARRLEVVERGGLADHEVAHEAPAEQRDLLDHVVDQVVRQAELRDAVAQHSAELVERLEHGDRETFHREQVGIDQA